MRKFFVVLTLVVCASMRGNTQQPLTAEWDMPFTSVELAQSYIYTYFIDNLTGVDFPAVVCGNRVVSDQNVTVCAAPLPPPSIGTHTIYLKVRDELGRTSDPSATVTFRYPVRPEAPTNLRIIRSS